MKKTVLNRLQGGLMGNLIVEQLIHHPTFLHLNTHPKTHLSSWSQLQWQIIENLITHQNCYFEPDTQHKLKDLGLLNNSSKLALATFGLNLYCHENSTLWQKQLNKILGDDQQLNTVKSDLMIYHQVINLILTEKVKPNLFLEQLLDHINQIKTNLTEKIRLINQLQKQAKSSTEIIKIIQQSPQPENNPLALAIYYFSDTIENIEISLARSINSPYQTLLTATLTASLTGLYHGWYDLPLKWRIMIKQQALFLSCQNLAQQLFALWCGVYLPQNQTFDPNLVIALPMMIQPR